MYKHILVSSTGMEGKEARIAAMRLAVAETFPEPNRRLLQRYFVG
jgi:hypothetical protein